LSLLFPALCVFIGDNGLRLAVSLGKSQSARIRVFLMGDCGSCMDARGIAEDMLAEGAKRGAF